MDPFTNMCKQWARISRPVAPKWMRFNFVCLFSLFSHLLFHVGCVSSWMMSRVYPILTLTLSPLSGMQPNQTKVHLWMPNAYWRPATGASCKRAVGTTVIEERRVQSEKCTNGKQRHRSGFEYVYLKESRSLSARVRVKMYLLMLWRGRRQTSYQILFIRLSSSLFTLLTRKLERGIIQRKQTIQGRHKHTQTPWLSKVNGEGTNLSLQEFFFFCSRLQVSSSS